MNIQYGTHWSEVVSTDRDEKNPDFIQVAHGKMVTNISLRLFKGRSSAIDQSQADEFKQKLSGRYPWLSSDATRGIMAEAGRVRAEQIDKEETPVQKRMELVSAGRYGEAVGSLDKHLRDYPDDFDAWQVRGEALYKDGRSEEGYLPISLALEKRKEVKRG
jgi:tetratricopeptide (TPR) repeat protein